MLQLPCRLTGLIFLFLVLVLAESTPNLRLGTIKPHYCKEGSRNGQREALISPPLASVPSLPSISPQTGSVFLSSFMTAALLYPLDLLRGLKMQSPGAATGTLVTKVSERAVCVKHWHPSSDPFPLLLLIFSPPLSSPLFLSHTHTLTHSFSLFAVHQGLWSSRNFQAGNRS